METESGKGTGSSLQYVQWATVNGGNGKWKRKTETENGNGKRKREMVVTAIRTQYKLSMPELE